jgi:hypothetical protein
VSAAFIHATYALGAVCVLVLLSLAAHSVVPLRRARAVAAAVLAAWWRLVPLTPPGRFHERHARRELGMARGHPEHVTRVPSRADKAVLAALQSQAWPENEWVFHIAHFWRDGR